MLFNIIRQELLKLEKLDNLLNSEIHFQTLREAFIANEDISLVKESPANNQIERTGMELLFGFYSEVDVSFDLVLQDEFYAHYELQKGKFYPLAKEIDKYCVLPLINLPYMKPTFITNVSRDIYAPDKLFLIGAVLKHETFRKEILKEPYYKDLLEI
jgi:hypothetical protein